MNKSEKIFVLQTVAKIVNYGEFKTFIMNTPSAIKRLNTLSASEKAGLLNYDKSFFSKYIDLGGLSLYEKITILDNVSYPKRIYKSVSITEDELKNLRPSGIFLLYMGHLEKYFYDSVYSILSPTLRSGLFYKYPEFLSNKGYNERIYSYSIDDIVNRKNLSYIDKNISTFTSTNYKFWSKLLGTDYSKYSTVFYDNIDTIHSPTDLRDIFRNYPQLLLLVKINFIKKSKMDVKSWVNLIRELKLNPRNNKFYKDWELPDDLKEWLREEMMIMVLNGKVKLTSHLKKSLEFTK